jgi:phosphotransacetylase
MPDITLQGTNTVIIMPDITLQGTNTVIIMPDITLQGTNTVIIMPDGSCNSNYHTITTTKIKILTDS